MSKVKVDSKYFSGNVFWPSHQGFWDRKAFGYHTFWVCNGYALHTIEVLVGMKWACEYVSDTHKFYITKTARTISVLGYERRNAVRGPF